MKRLEAAATRRLVPILLASLVTGFVGTALAQQGGGTDTSARAAATVDMTGYWVSVIHEDWAWRMRTPPPGDYASIPLNEEGIRVADRWTESQDGSCLAHGAAAALRMPTRAHITWADDNTLQIDIDNGVQTRLLHFAPRTGDATRSLQGYSTARWATDPDLDTPPWSSLEVSTTGMQAAWLRPNGVPYSEDAVLIEFFDRYSDGDDEWFTVTTIVEDPTYLTEPLVISSNFKREPNGANWNPQPCRP